MLNNNKKINVGYPLLVGEQAPSVDLRFGPYASVAEAVTRLGASGLDQLVGGVFFGVTQADGTLKVYFFNKDNATATDVTEVGSNEITAGSIATNMIADGSITEDKLDSALRDAIAQAGKADGVTISKNASTGELSVKNGGVSTTQLADSAVTTPKIADGTVSEAKLDSTLSSKINGKANSADVYTKTQTDALLALKADATALADKQDKLTADQLAAVNSGVTAVEFAKKYEKPSTGIPSSDIAGGSITNSKIADGSVTTAKLADDAVTSAKLADNAVLTDNIKNAQVTKDKLANDAKVGSLVVTEEETDVKLHIKDAAGSVIASDTIAVATTTAAGMMSKDDKAKIDGVSAGAQANTIEIVKVNGGALVPDASKAVNVEVITTVKQNNVVVGSTLGQVNVTDTTYTFSGATADKIIVTPYANGAAGTPVDVPLTIANNITETTDTTQQGAIGDLAIYTAAHIIGKRSIATGIVADDTSDAIATAKTVAAYVKAALGDLAGAMIYKGLVNSTDPLPSTDYKVGDTYVVSEVGTYAGVACEVGDMLTAKTAYVAATASDADWTACHSAAAVENKDVTLVAGTKSVIATVDGTDITVTAPAVDDVLSDSSLNPLQNKVVYEELEKLKVRYLNVCFGENALSFSYPNIAGDIEILKVAGMNISELKLSHGATLQQSITLGEQSPAIEVSYGENIILEIGRTVAGIASLSIQYKTK